MAFKAWINQINATMNLKYYIGGSVSPGLEHFRSEGSSINNHIITTKISWNYPGKGEKLIILVLGNLPHLVLIFLNKEISVYLSSFGL